MKRIRDWISVMHTCGCALSAVGSCFIGLQYDGGEYASGLITGPLLKLFFGGSILFLAALGLSFVNLKVSALASIIASPLCMIFYIYNALPISFLNRVLPYPSKLWDESGRIRLHWPSDVAVVVVLLTAYLAIRLLRKSG